MEHGFLWNFGFMPGGSGIYPAEYPEYGLVTPFYLHGENGRQMLLYNANYLYDTFAAAARYDLPVTIFQHTEYAVLRNPQAMEDTLVRIGRFQQDNLYNFVTEPQFARALAAAMHSDVRIYSSLADICADFLRRLTGRAPRFDRYIVIEPGDCQFRFLTLFTQTLSG
jgi:hypothetical protein